MLNKRKLDERQRRKELILNGALKVFNNLGIEKTTMDEIAVESGFGKATLYYYFHSKDDVFSDIMEKGWRELWEGIESLIITDAGPREKFIGIIREMGKIVTNDKRSTRQPSYRGQKKSLPATRRTSNDRRDPFFATSS